jgi:hypothetical protein
MAIQIKKGFIMSSGFKDPTKIKKQKPLNLPEGPDRNWPFSFKAPKYDERSSCFINAGTHYGVGHAQPIGHKNDPKVKVDVLPMGRVETMRIDEAG